MKKVEKSSSVCLSIAKQYPGFKKKISDLINGCCCCYLPIQVFLGTFQIVCTNSWMVNAGLGILFWLHPFSQVFFSFVY